ncbi:hypothetical protein [Streptomyces sp. SP18CS02]|uniref:hypothetical protein n=1 Tax=Streptomyces sp. SP18CS02 TaxID=3002531 RepID=UPI002E7AA318|nr:hypothetical protein [Streptomyces sp. SP18CS02]MEE1753256.1 hypothetical protein [Streptomyces sp. SP18CS02]
MTVCAIEAAAKDDGSLARTDFVIAADGAYAARLAGEGEALFPERWTLSGPEPYAVPLPLRQPEDPHAQLLPLVDGRVLIARRAGGRFVFSLLYPTGPGTGELSLGSVEAASLRLLPPSPEGTRAYATVTGERSTTVWLVAGGTFGPERVAEVEGRCSGGVWLDRTGRMLALDRRQDGGPVKTVAVDLRRGGETTPLLQITEESNDRLLLADADSGLLLIRSDAPSPGHDRLGWGVLGSTRPVRFPDCLRPADVAVTPFAVQPGQVLMPEGCSVALRIDGAAGSWVGVWRPSGRRLHQLAAPPGWLPGTGLWTREGVLQLPCATRAVRCALARWEMPAPAPASVAVTQPAQPECAGGEPSADGTTPGVCRPVPLQQAPLTGRTARG